MTNLFTIMIPVFNETKALEFSDFYFRRLDIPVVYALDTQHMPESLETLRALDRPFSIFENDKPFIENGYANFARCSPTDWILRLDCDEVVGPELIEACRVFVEKDPNRAAAFDRYQLFWQNDGLCAATAEPVSSTAHRQVRLFNRQRATFFPHIHTSGLQTEFEMLPGHDVAIYHLEWMFLSWDDRVNKSAKYDQLGQIPFHRQHQLLPLEDAGLQPIDVPPVREAYADWLNAASDGRPAADDGMAGCAELT